MVPYVSNELISSSERVKRFGPYLAYRIFGDELDEQEGIHMFKAYTGKQ